jgi:hypothetical protein
LIIYLGVEELFESEGLGTGRACPSGTKAAHKGVAVLTELRTDLPRLAVGALIDGVVLAGPGGR